MNIGSAKRTEIDHIGQRPQRAQKRRIHAHIDGGNMPEHDRKGGDDLEDVDIG